MTYGDQSVGFDVGLWYTDLPLSPRYWAMRLFITRIGDTLRKTGKDQGFRERLVLDQEEPGLPTDSE